MNDSIETLLAMKQDERDETWEKRFLKALPSADVKVMVPEPSEGPDGWPYLMVETGSDVDAHHDDKLANVLGWLSTRGIGLVLNPQKPLPDAVLTWGMIWNWRERGELITEQPIERHRHEGAASGRFEIKDGQEVLAGAPSEAYLPGYVRTVLKQFLLDQGVFAPKVLMVSVDKVNYDLCFSIESLKSPPAHEHGNIVEALAWFLPVHYSISLLSEKTVPGFQAL